MPNLLLLALLATFPALSTDMYLPALPTLQEIWSISPTQANYSLVAYFLSFSVCLLIHGPLSDRVGRKPVLLGGILVFIAGSLLCAVSPSISWLVAARIIQAAGAAAAFTLSLALSKDLYKGEERQRILAYIGVILSLFPMLAPTLGGWLLLVASWRWIFVAQATLALMALYGSFRLREPLTTFTRGGVAAVAARYLVLFRNKRYVAFTVAFSLMTIGHFAYIGGSSDIFISGYGLSEQVFGYYFGFNALGLMLGSLTCSYFCSGIRPNHVITLTLLALLGVSGFLAVEGGSTPWMLAMPMFGISYLLGVTRPISNNMILEEVDEDIGAASSLLTFAIFLFASVAMWFISLDWANKSAMIGKLTLFGTAVPLAALWVIDRKKKHHG